MGLDGRVVIIAAAAGLLVSAGGMAAQEAEPASISGVAVDAVSGAPLGKVQIRMQLARGDQEDPVNGTTTDGKGNFGLTGLMPGVYHLKASRSGYLETYYGSLRADVPAPVRLDAGQKLSGITVKLKPFGVIAGTVRDRDGEPVSGVDVRLWSWQYYAEQNVRWFSGRNRIKSNDLGEYRFSGLAPGEYFVQVVPAEDLRDLVDRSAGRKLDVDVPTFYPGTTEPSAAMAVKVAAGVKMTAIDIALVHTRAYRMSGVVSTDTAVPRLMAQLVRGELDGLWDIPAVVAVKDGTFLFPVVAPGSYTLMVGNTEYQTETHVDVGAADVDGLRVVMGPPAEVTGQVTMEGGDGPSSIDFGFSFVTRGRSFGRMNLERKVTAQLYPGKYDVFFDRRRNESLFLKSVTLDGVDVLADGVTISGPGKLSLEAVVSRESGQVAGTVTDGDSAVAQGATVLMVPKVLKRPSQSRVATTDQDGRYEFKGVGPGEYRVLALGDAEPGSWLDSGFWKGREGQGMAVTVRAKETASAAITVGK